ncbi:MAG: hypothetical protein ACK4TG_01220 [Thermaurantiacus sp.]
MPAFQTLVEHLNKAFSRDGLQNTRKMRDAFAPGTGLDGFYAVMRDAPEELVDHVRDFLRGAPPVMVEATRAAIHAALSGEHPTPVTLLWAPGYDFEMHLWQAPDTGMTRGGVSILFKSRYPSDRHPLPDSGPVAG